MIEIKTKISIEIFGLSGEKNLNSAIPSGGYGDGSASDKSYGLETDA